MSTFNNNCKKCNNLVSNLDNCKGNELIKIGLNSAQCSIIIMAIDYTRAIQNTGLLILRIINCAMNIRLDKKIDS